jgi:hypothetical protein
MSREHVCQLDDNGVLGHENAYASPDHTFSPSTPLLSAETCVPYIDIGTDSSSVHRVMEESDGLDPSVLQEDGQHNIAHQRYYPWSASHSIQYYSNTDLAAGPCAPFATPNQHSSYVNEGPYVFNNGTPVDARTPSDNSQEDHWASGESSAMTSQTSLDPRYPDMVESRSTLRPPSSTGSGRSSHSHLYRDLPLTIMAR